MDRNDRKCIVEWKGDTGCVCVCNSYHTYVYDVQAGTLIHCVPNVICAIASVNAFLRCSALLQFWHCYLHMFWIFGGDINAS